ncbi:unnamed protein product [Blepharisma stoltei]|uniref:Uncharacterized protein n=1 Tax=Blepharisma stoltei TaxID=1481888 RepID=A0AAU9JP19_9CILI|nr:unnamed protein product [Blepharisma stoltei]
MGSCCATEKGKVLPYVLDVHVQCTPCDNTKQEIKKKMWVQKAKNAPKLNINSNPLYKKRMSENLTRSSRTSLISNERASRTASCSLLYGF